MVVISTRELVQSRDKYFDMALAEPIVVRRKKRLYEIRPVDDDNPSPSGDPYFADVNNRANVFADVLQSEQEIANGECVVLTPELKQKLFGNV